jgi:hypothetical protein
MFINVSLKLTLSTITTRLVLIPGDMSSGMPSTLGKKNDLMKLLIVAILIDYAVIVIFKC